MSWIAWCLCSLACGEVSRPEAADENWSRLDADIAALAANARAPSGASVSATLRFNYASSNDFTIPYDADGNGTIAPGEGNELGGFLFDNAQVAVEGSVGAWQLRVSLEAAVLGTLGGPLVQDAFARTPVSEHMSFQAGQFRSPVLGSSLLEPNGLLFILRTDSQQLWYDRRDRAAMLDADYGRFGWALSVENGGDSAGDELAYTARAAVDLLGNGANTSNEGAFGASDELCATLGVAYHDDQSVQKEGEVLALEALATLDRFAAQAEWLDYGDDGGTLLMPGLYSVFSDTQPWAVAASYMLVEDAYELALRWQDTDNFADQTAWSVGLNHYITGHDCKVQANYINADFDHGDAQTFALGVTVHI